MEMIIPRDDLTTYIARERTTIRTHHLIALGKVMSSKVSG